MSNETAQKPATTIRIGAIKATVWANKANGQTFYNVTITRTYKQDDKYADTNSFGRDDLLTVAKVADMAHTWITSKLAE